MNSIIIKKHQSGVILVVSMIMLLLLTLIGITGMQVTGLEEKMAHNSVDKNKAFQAAEAALRDAERFIESAAFVAANAAQSDTCTGGVCTKNRVYSNIEDDSTVLANAKTYTSPELTGLAGPPKYLIVPFDADFSGTAAELYRITAIATGAKSTTRSVLQIIYSPIP